MRKAWIAFSLIFMGAISLSGCGLLRFEQREPWRLEAEEACQAQKQVRVSHFVARAPEINGPGICGITYPYKVAAFKGGEVGLNRQATLACPMVARTDLWIEQVVQPAAQLYFGASVVEIQAGSYACRSRNNQRGAKLSEHAFGNALDIMGFRFADGRDVKVVSGWRGTPAEQDFLREVFVGACEHFNTVLGPGSDMFHYDHLHIDLARHDPKGMRKVCRPVLKFTPRIGVAQAGSELISPKVPLMSAKPLAPVQPFNSSPPALDLVEEEPDVEEVSSHPAPPPSNMTMRGTPPVPAPSYPALSPLLPPASVGSGLY
jgi:hypothetical protein